MPRYSVVWQRKKDALPSEKRFTSIVKACRFAKTKRDAYVFEGRQRLLDWAITKYAKKKVPRRKQSKGLFGLKF